MSELTYKWNNQDNELDEYKDGEYTTCHSEQEIADEMNDYRKALTNSNNKVDDLELKLAEARELEIEIIRKMHLCLLGDISHKEVILSLKSMFEEQLKEKG